jgi:hypothetical protein
MANASLFKPHQGKNMTFLPAIVNFGRNSPSDSTDECKHRQLQQGKLPIQT